MEEDLHGNHPLSDTECGLDSLFLPNLQVLKITPNARAGKGVGIYLENACKEEEGRSISSLSGEDHNYTSLSGHRWQRNEAGCQGGER